MNIPLISTIVNVDATGISVSRSVGGTWHYDMSNWEKKRYTEELKRLNQRKTEGWTILALAIFGRPNGKSLKLEDFAW
ncbi:Uncharacterised protein [Candidatus Anstonella stagnisolia]|nr:Uncharacterised protein [Candidatus Anstonella stagnisolia]